MNKEEAIKIVRDGMHLSCDKGNVIEALTFLVPELKESEDEKIRKEIISALEMGVDTVASALFPGASYTVKEAIAWLYKQKEQKPVNDTLPFKAEHGRYYYCIKDFFCGGNKQASKGDVIQALRGLPIMGLEDASEYFLPVNSIEHQSAEWSEEDKQTLNNIIWSIHMKSLYPLDEMDDGNKYKKYEKFLKSLPERFNLQPKQEWSEEDEKRLSHIISFLQDKNNISESERLFPIEEDVRWLKSLKHKAHLQIKQWDKDMLDSIIKDYESVSKSFSGYQGKLDFLKAIRNGEYNF